MLHVCARGDANGRGMLGTKAFSAAWSSLLDWDDSTGVVEARRFIWTRGQRQCEVEHVHFVS